MNQQMCLAQAEIMRTLARNLLGISSQWAILREPVRAKESLAQARECASKAELYTNLAFSGEQS